MRNLAKTVVILIIMPILIVGLTCLDTSANQNVPFKPRAFLKDSILTPGDFHYLNVTLEFESENIYIVAYSGKYLPESEVRSTKNYYRWEYNQGVWIDASGYDSTYIDKGKCIRTNNTYSFCISLSENVNPGSWTIKIFVDNKEVSCNSLNVIIGDFCLFFSTIVGVFQPCIKNRNFLAEKDLICNDQERKMIVSEKNIDETAHQVIKKQANSQEDKTTINKKFYYSILNEKPLDKQELVKSNVFTYPRSKLKLIENNGAGSLFLDKNFGDLSGFCKNFFVLVLAIFLIVSCFSPMIIAPENDADITIINVQSYPAVGDEWIVMFTTVGRANLIITAVNGTNWSDNSNDYDLRFLELKRGNESLDYEWIDNSVFVSNFSADEICFEVSKVLTPGNHTLMFCFGDDIAYAFNDAVTNTSVDDISPYNVVYTPYDITATGNSSLDNVTLWYRWSIDNSSWNSSASWVNDSVDSNSCNVDGSADKGTETNFANCQGVFPDTYVMTLQENQTNDLTDHKDAVDSNTSNVDGSADKGVETNFPNVQDTSPDADVMVIQEIDQGVYHQVEFISAGAGTAGTGTSFNVPYPSNPQQGDLFIMQVMILGTTTSVNVPSGWNIMYGPNTTGNNDGRQWTLYNFS
ncbi:MAG: hypothetical protein QHH19_05915, partial [Candidatus Thermoplasmatota archaeon]|nr:hypothetical protein [Candidatus Thermoplasmatota archaeon]